MLQGAGYWAKFRIRWSSVERDFINAGWRRPVNPAFVTYLDQDQTNDIHERKQRPCAQKNNEKHISWCLRITMASDNVLSSIGQTWVIRPYTQPIPSQDGSGGDVQKLVNFKYVSTATTSVHRPKPWQRSLLNELTPWLQETWLRRPREAHQFLKLKMVDSWSAIAKMCASSHAVYILPKSNLKKWNMATTFPTRPTSTIFKPDQRKSTQ